MSLPCARADSLTPRRGSGNGTGITLMKFGLLVDCHVRKDQTQTLAFDEMFAQIDAAEATGMDSVWIVEHHFRPQASVLSSCRSRS